MCVNKVFNYKCFFVYILYYTQIIRFFQNLQVIGHIKLQNYNTFIILFQKNILLKM